MSGDLLKSSAHARIASTIVGNRYAIPTICLLVIAAAYTYFLLPAGVQSSPGVATHVSSGTAGHVLRIAMSQRHPGDSPPVLQLKPGTTGTITVVPDQPGEIMLHGYPGMPMWDAKPGIETVIQLAPTTTGVFPLHLHTPSGQHVEIANVEVWPN